VALAAMCATVEGRVKDLNSLTDTDRAGLRQERMDVLVEEGEAEDDEDADQGDVEEGEEEDEEEDEEDDDEIISPTACDHCLRVDFYDLGKSCGCMFDCCRPFHYDTPDVAKLPLACQHYYYDTKQWQTCDDPCTYCTKTEYLGFKGQNECFKSCCSVDLDDVTDEDTKLSYRVSASCHDWQNALTKSS